MDPQLSELKMAIARDIFTTEERKALGNAFDPMFTELTFAGGPVVRGARIVVPR